MNKTHTAITIILSALTGALVSAAAIGMAWYLYASMPKAAQVITVEFPAAPLLVTQVVERIITSTPAPVIELAAAPIPQATPTPQPTATATQSPVDYAEVVSLDIPAEVVTGRTYTARVTVRNVGDMTWQNYGVACPVGLVIIERLEPGAAFEAAFEFIAGESTYGEYKAFEFRVLNASAEVVPWKPAGGLVAPLEPVVNVRTIGYRPTDLPPEKWEDFLNQSLPMFKWKCDADNHT